MAIARPVVAELTSTFRGVSREDAQRQAEGDATAKRASGYELAGQDWGEDAGIATLNVRYRHTGNVVLPAASGSATVTTPTKRGGLLGWRKATWAIWIWTGLMVAWIVSGFRQ